MLILKIAVGVCVGIVLAVAAILGFLIKFGKVMAERALKDASVASITVSPPNSPVGVVVNLRRDEQIAS